jgi:hypothetical protein
LATALLIPGAAVLTYWEQSVTGVFRLGLLNQVESLIILTGALVVSGLFGTGVYRTLSLGPIDAQTFLLVWPATTILFGVLRHLWRVRGAAGGRALLPIAGFITLELLFLVIFLNGSIGLVAAVAAGSTLAVYYGMHMLSQRMNGERPELTWVLQIAWIPLVLLRSPEHAEIVAILDALLFSAMAVLETSRGLRRLAQLEA